MTKRFLKPIVVGGLVGLVGAAAFSFGLFSTWSARLTDRFFLARDVDPRIVLVTIDDASLSKIGRWPWPRNIHAQLVTALHDAGARVVGMDVNFPEASNAADDTALADAIRSAGNVILPIELPLRDANGKVAYDPNGVIQPITQIQSAAKAVGHTNSPLESDGVVRRIPLFAVAPDGSKVRAFGYELAVEVLGAAGLPVMPTDKLGYLFVHFPNVPRAAFRRVSAADVLQRQTDLAAFKDAIVLIGATAPDLHDEQYVPTSGKFPMSGVEIHASLLDTILGRHWLAPMDPWVMAAMLVVFGLMLGVLVPSVRARVSATVSIILWIACLVGAFFAFDRGILVDVLWPTIVLVFGYLILVIDRWAETERHRSDLRHAFSRYVSHSVVESILKNPAKLKLGGERRRMTVMFSDLRGFTTLSEGLSPEKLVEVLNKYLNAMTEIVFEEGGVLDKYIGDAVMAFWNAPMDQADHGLRGVRTAVKMNKKLKEMNGSGAFPSGIVLKVGVGLNTGEMVVGNIGGEQRYDYTVIGDSVNLASRTESLCKEYGAEVIVTENTFGELKGEFLVRKLDKVAVKGKKEPIMLYQVFGMKGDETPELMTRISSFEAALEAYFARRFEEAMVKCEELLTQFPEDVAAKNLLEHCRIYLEKAPPEGWDGTWVMTKK